jgi:hypothetical protein
MAQVVEHPPSKQEASWNGASKEAQYWKCIKM